MNNNMVCRTFVVKVSGSCNIACKYCYMFRGGDTSFKDKPKFMTIDIAKKTIMRAREHCKKNEIPIFNFVLHGGEPLLSGKAFIEEFIDIAKEAFRDLKTKLIVGIQTNGTLINDEWCNFLSNNKLNLGISIDGVKEDNDQYRVDRMGNGTFDRIVSAINLCHKYKLKPGLLSVINVDSNPKEVYDLYKSLSVEAADILLLEANYDKLPRRATKGQFVDSETPYGDWLIQFFDLWYNDTENFYNRHFSQYIKSILGAEINGDDMGDSTNDILTIETNGNYESEDALRICGDNFTKTEVNVKDNNIEDALSTKLANIYYFSHHNLSIRCLSCPIKETCGGGYLPHRYSSQNGFNNPSVYCKDLLKLITHIQNVVIDDLPKLKVDNINIEKITYDEALNIINKAECYVPQKDYFKALENF
jgi:uncharacterized protein